jgi:hypothetical protein
VFGTLALKGDFCLKSVFRTLALTEVPSFEECIQDFDSEQKCLHLKSASDFDSEQKWPSPEECFRDLGLKSV